MDITTDGFGFMLAVGDLAWVPFVYSLQARYLVWNQIELGPVNTAAIIAVNLLGYYIFRAANGEKNDFRNGRNPKSAFIVLIHPGIQTDHLCDCLDLQYIDTERGTKLLVSGWWGFCRHPNYVYVLPSLGLRRARAHQGACCVAATSSWPSRGLSRPASTLLSRTST